MTSTVDVVTPIDQFLARQQQATAVERFSAIHDADVLERVTEPGGERWYADRLPAGPPGPGQQYAFRVDLDRCSGCKACVAACHSLNGLDEGESWRSVGELVDRTGTGRAAQHVPTGCHHCVDPACLSGCPTNAYEKDPITGIVRHLDDQCIGCSYCELTCPYEVPKLNNRLGVVRKCDLCADRLAEGEAPACVQGCPTSAITIDVVDVARVRASADAPLVPGAPASDITVPTTTYVSAEPIDGTATAADRHAVRRSHAHPPLAFMLVVTQLSVGAFLLALVGDVAVGPSTPGSVGAAGAGVVALGGSLFHLGRPLVAWRAILGLGHSWLSREIVAFGVYAAGAVAYAGAGIAGIDRATTLAIGAVAAVAGVVGVACSCLIYIVTRRRWWSARYTVPKFAATALFTGIPLTVTVWTAVGVGDEWAALSSAACAVAAAAGSAVLVDEALLLRRARRRPASPDTHGPLGPDPEDDLDRTALLLTGPLAVSTRLRFGAGGAGVAASAALAVVVAGAEPGPAVAVLGVLAVGTVSISEGAARLQFFAASVAPRMPGSFGR